MIQILAESDSFNVADLSPAGQVAFFVAIGAAAVAFCWALARS